MTVVRAHMSISLDGFTAGVNQTLQKPFGDNTEHLNDWMFATRALRESFRMEGGETGPSDDVVRERNANVGAVIMGRKMFGGGPGPWATDKPWTGWWGDEPPFHTPVFVLTNYARDDVPMAGGTTFHFVTEGVQVALDRALEAAGDKDVLVSGGANVVRQFLRAQLLDELEFHLVPVLVGDGESLLAGLADSGLELEQNRAIEAKGVTHLKYRVVK